MKFLIDNNLSPYLSELLINAGHDALHVKKLGMCSASDNEIFKLAFEEERTIISADTDFGFILSKWDKNLPSVILFRFLSTDPQIQFGYLNKIIIDFKKEIVERCIFIVEPARVRVKKLPY
jgi:predicted nuclease of predicted toxin-antitoxin system